MPREAPGSRAISYHFNKTYWSKSEVKTWLRLHNATSRHLYMTTNEIRAPQIEESAYRASKFKRYGKMYRWSNTFGKPFWILVAGFKGARRNPGEVCSICRELPSIIELMCSLCSEPFDACQSCYTAIEGLKIKPEEEQYKYVCYFCTYAY